MVQVSSEFTVFDRKRVFRRSGKIKHPHCRYDMLKVKRVGKKDFDVINKEDVTYIVRYNDKVQHLTCTCGWGVQCISSENFEKDCRHVKAVNQYIVKMKRGS